MNLFHRSPRLAALLLAPLAAIGCANPGPPRPPSLHLPEAVRDLSVVRSGDTVEVRFTLPSLSTDKLPLHGSSLSATLCREVDARACAAVPAFTGLAIALAAPGAAPVIVTWRDALPAALASGNPRLLGYRVELFNVLGRSAGKSDAAFTLAGQAPAKVDGLHAQGSREGVVLGWIAAPRSEGDVLLRREDLAPQKKAEPKAAHRDWPLDHQPGVASTRKDGEADLVWLNTNADGHSQTLDTTALPGVPYRYVAVRRRTVQFGGRAFELRSLDSAALNFTLREIYPPAAPTGLVAAGFTAQPGSQFAVDLVWQPVDDAKLAGYNVYRQTIDSQGFPVGDRVKLNDAAVALPGFHDATANSALRYRYSVTAFDPEGNESGAATAVLEPTQAQ